MAQIKFNDQYAQMFADKELEKQSPMAYGACGTLHSDEDIQECEECLRVHKVVLKKRDKAIDDLWNLMGNAQIAYKEQIEAKIAAGEDVEAFKKKFTPSKSKLRGNRG